MRSNAQTVQKMQKIFKQSSVAAIKAKDYIKLGLTGRQWLASLVICMLLLPVFSLPIGATVVIPKADPNVAQFEPVNAELPIWETLSINLSAKVEEWMTPRREVNVIHGEKENDKKKTDEKKKSDKKKKIKEKDKIDEKSSAEINYSENEVKLSSEKEEKSKEDEEKTANKKTEFAETESQNEALKSENNPVIEKEKSSLSTAVPNETNKTLTSPAFFSTRSEEEIESLFTPQNNLGAPFGQVEAQGRSSAVAMLRSRERIGSSNFSFEAPVASLPGRGIDAEVNLSYNSRVWNTTPNPFNGNPIYRYNTDGNWLAPGFSLGLGKLELLNYYNFSLTSPDGTRHQFFYVSGGTYARTYESADGTFMRLDTTYTTQPGTGNIIISSAVLKDSNGRVINYLAANTSKLFPTKITDNNGNFIEISYKTGDTEGRIDQIKDTLGRYINFHYDSSNRLVTVTVPGFNNSSERQTIRFYYETMTFPTADRFANGGEVMPSNIDVLKYVYFPGTKSGYKYEYSSGYGMIYKVSDLRGMEVSLSDLNVTGTVTDDGEIAASTTYNYPLTVGTPLSDVPKYTTRTDDWASTPTAQSAVTIFNAVVDNGYTKSTITSPDGTITETWAKIASGSWDDGLVTDTFVKTLDGSQTYKIWSHTKTFWGNQSSIPGRKNPKITKVEETNEAGQTRATTFDYDNYNNETLIKEHDFAAPGQLGTELERTEITYQTGINWINNRIYSLPTIVKKIVNNVTVARTDYEYDNYGVNESNLTPRTGILMFNQAYNPTSGSYNSNTKYRGNVTKTTAFSNAALSSDANADVKNYSYDIAGNLVTAPLSCCNIKTYDYGQSYSETGYAYPVRETQGSSPQLINETAYDYNTGLVISTKNENDQYTYFEYEPDTLRQKKMTYPNGGYSQTEYSDKLAPGSTISFVRTTTTLDTNKTAQSYSYFDGRGINVRNATQTPDGWSVSATDFDLLGRPVKSYNPFYVSSPTNNIPQNTKFTEVLNYDALGRATSVRLQDLTIVSTAFSNQSTTPSGFNKTFITVTDQAGKQRRQIADALDRLVRVDEPDLSGNLGAVDSPIQPTVYEYDGNDNLSKIIQTDGTVTQERKFKYDSLSRLTHEKQVEANPTLNDSGVHGSPDPNNWTKVLKYNLDGLLSEATDARSVKTTLLYDGLNRVQSVTFTDGTPSINYTYDQARTGFFNKGSLTRVETADGGALRPDTPATATEFDYDQMGRVKANRQMIGTQTYAMEYGYNLAGQMVSEKYPSGRVVSTNYDANGRLSGIADQSRTYLNSLQYQQHGGALSSTTLGNGIQQTLDYNERLQMKQIAWTKSGNVVQRYDYAFGQINPSNNTVDPTKNNGQIAQVESYIGGTVSNPTKQFTQKFVYDSIGRLKQETETRGDNSNQVYQQIFSYDNFGNRYLKATDNPSNQNPLFPTLIEDNNIDRTSNRLASNTNTVYDDTGNITTDGKYRNLKYYYDANGRMYKTSQTNDTNQANSVYDAGGKKVATKVNDVWRFLIYDIGGKLIAEYGGTDSMDEGGVKFVHQDLQGSTRFLTSLTGTVLSRMDYQAFGEEIPQTIGQRTAQGYGTSDSIRQRYGLTERDEATGLDDTWFRKLEQRGGRWTSPDPYNGSMLVSNPQSFNRYSYVTNNPTNLNDPTGLCSYEIHYSVLSDGQIRIDRIVWGSDCRVTTSRAGNSRGGGGGGGGASGEVGILSSPRTKSVGNGGGGGGGPKFKLLGDDLDKAKKEAECLQTLQEDMITLTMENLIANAVIVGGVLAISLISGGSAAVIALIGGVIASAGALAVAIWKIYIAEKRYRRCMRNAK